jgi:cellulose synthase/poly-beta-1,6-N-acetylglucosamine synthase-like glycosyltransferase
MSLSDPAVAFWLQAGFLAYFVAINLHYLVLNLIASVTVRRLHLAARLAPPAAVAGELYPPISVLVPAHNEEATIVASVQSILQLRYSDFEVIVIDDGSRDSTRDQLIETFDLRQVSATRDPRLPTAPVRAVYRSPRHPNLVLVEKERGGKSDALNAGINHARMPLFCAIDADSVLQHDSLARIARPFLDDSRTIAVGGSVRLANGCRVSGGYLESVGIPAKLLPRIQIVEYLRAFLFARLGWSPLNALLIVSGAFGLFRTAVVVGVGGYRKSTIGEDMDLVVRLHRHCRKLRRPYRIAFVPDPVCWTEAPETLRTLRHQRRRWQQGLLESLWSNRRLLLHPRGGTAGWLAFPSAVLFEAVGPVLEIAGYLALVACWLAGAVSGTSFVAYLVAAIGLGLFLSVSALLLEEVAFHRFSRPRDLGSLVAAAVLENMGYRQLTTLWQLEGLARWLLSRPHKWGDMNRSASWKQRP